jgi:hypothetical protein
VFYKSLVCIHSGAWRCILFEDGVIGVLGVRSINDLIMKGIGGLRTCENSIGIRTFPVARTFMTRVITDVHRDKCMS